MEEDIRWPLDRNVIRGRRVSNTFGTVRVNRDGSRRPHQGWDLEAPIGTACFAIADGKIEFVSSAGGLGHTVVLAFSFEGRTLYAVYAHLSAIDVKSGQAVKKGHQVGRTGDSGNAQGMQGAELHLHFEIRTSPRPGLGLGGRISPLELYRAIPLNAPIFDAEAAADGPSAAAPVGIGSIPQEAVADLPVTGKGWEIHIKRHTVQHHGGRTRTVGTYRVYHDGKPVSSFRLGGKDVPLAGTTAEPKGPGQNDRPASDSNPSRIRPGRYPLATQSGGNYKTFGYSSDPTSTAYPLPGIELLGTGRRTEILIHPGKNAYISSIGCINLCKDLSIPGDTIDFPGSRLRVIALIEDMKSYLKSSFPSSGANAIANALAVIEGEP